MTDKSKGYSGLTKPSQGRQTTLFQTWGYEGNNASQIKTDKEDDKDEFDDDDEEFARVVNESILEQNKAGPSHTSAGASTSFGRPSTGAIALESLPGFDVSAGATWIYPTNKSFRSYQYDIVQSCLFKNTLVCLPTGLGKTFIAAVVMYNFYRWYPQGKIVFMAPTKPLVAQQIEACFNIMGIPQDDTMEMTGSVSVSHREKGWKSKRVFFLTPQVMSNDLSRGLFPAREVKLLIVDEAHKAQGEYAYCQVAKELNRSQAVVRIVALSATPGNDLAAVRGVLQNLFISHIELRHEESPDIVPYTNERRVDKIVVPMGAELTGMKEGLLSVLEIYTKRLANHGALRQGHNPAQYSKFSILRSRDEWRQNPPPGLTAQVKGVVEGDYASAMSLYHGYELLLQHGMRPFYNFFNKKEEADYSSKRIRTGLDKIPVWRDLMANLAEKFSGDATNSRLNQSRIHLSQTTQAQTQSKTKTSHPKIEKLIEVVLEHFTRFKEKNMETRVMIFSQYRDSVTEVVACLSEYSPIIKPMSFVGQAGAQGKKGLTQKEQLEVLSRFRNGGYNTLVATCVGEEGLDIGEVDLIVLFDVSKSPIRLVQRMGRTGRKREGRIVVLVTQGIEERKYNQCLISKKTINKAILEMDKLVHMLYQNAPRMVPLGLEPVCHQMKMITGEFKGRGQGKNDRQGQGIMKSLQPVNRYDVFRKNCGFLNENDQTRWSEHCNFTDSVKRLPAPRELWTGEYSLFSQAQDNIENGPVLDLTEYSLWQTGDQNRYLVGESNVSRTYKNILELISNPSALSARAEELSTNLQARSAGRDVSSNAVSKRGTPLAGSPVKGIRNYFKLSESSDTNQELEKPRGQLLPDIQENNIEEIDISSSPSQPKLQDGVDVVVELDDERDVKDAEDDLLDDLLDDEGSEDSGFSSWPSSPVFKIDLENIVRNPPLNKVSVEEWMSAKLKYQNLYLNSSTRYTEYIQRLAEKNCHEGDLVVQPVQLEQEPVQLDQEGQPVLIDQEVHASSLDMFYQTDDEDLGFQEENEPDPIPSPVLKKPEGEKENGNKSELWSQFELGSPEPELLEEEDNDVPAPGRGIHEGEGISIQFDIGSPILELSPNLLSPVQFNLSPEKSKMASEKSKMVTDTEEFDPIGFPSSPIISKLNTQVSRMCEISLPAHLKRKRQIETSTPLHPHQLKPFPSLSSPVTRLTPVKERVGSDHSPVLKKPEPRVKSVLRTMSEDMFGNSDDDLFTDLHIPGEQREQRETSILGATQLVSVLNQDSEEWMMGAGIDKSDNHVKTKQSDKSTSILAATPGLIRSKRDQDVPNERRKSGGLKVKKKLSSVFDDADIFEDLSVIKEPDDLVYFPSFHHKPTAVVQPTSAVVQRSTPSETIISSNAGVVNSEAVTDMANFQLSIDMSEDMFGEDFLDQVDEMKDASEINVITGNIVHNEESRIIEEIRTTTDRRQSTVIRASEISGMDEPSVSGMSSSVGRDNIPGVDGMRMNACPICNQMIEGEEGGPEINAHVDTCLSKQLIDEFSQQQDPQSEADQSNNQQTDRSNNRVLEKSISSETSFSFTSPQSKKPQLNSPSPVLTARSRLKRNLVESSSEDELRNSYRTDRSDEDSPVFRGRKKPGILLGTQTSPIIKSEEEEAEDDRISSINEESKHISSLTRLNSSSEHEASSPLVRKKKRKGLGAEFLDVEAEVSGSDVSEDEKVDEDGFEESFVDDATQREDTAMYLRSIRSPVFKHPDMGRKLRPITDDLFSQMPEDSEGSYLEDSFCVGSQHVEYISEPETLDLLEEKVEIRGLSRRKEMEKKMEMYRNKRKRNTEEEKQKEKTTENIGKRRRIIAPVDDSILEASEDLSTQSESLLKNYNKESDLQGSSRSPAVRRLEPQPGPSATRDNTSRLDNTMDNSLYFVKPDLSASGCTEKASIVIGSTEVNKIPDIISLLKHSHQLNVVVRQSEVPFIVSTRMAVLRIMEPEFILGTNRKKLDDKLGGMRENYDKCVVIVESEKVKPGERSRTRARTKVYDLAIAQLAATQIQVLYSKNKECTGRILSELVHRENNKGMGLPRVLRLTVSQEEILKWILNLPFIGLGSGLHLVFAFSTIRSIVLATRQVLEEKGRLSKGRSAALFQIFSSKYNHDADFQPL